MRFFWDCRCLVLLVLLSACGAVLWGQAGGGYEDLLEAATGNLRMGRFAEAEAAVRKALEQRPREAHAWKVLGVIFAAQGRHAQAAEPFTRACELDRREPDACYYLARNHYLLNRFEESLRVLDGMKAGRSRDWRLLNARGLALMGLGQYEEAEAAFKNAMKHEGGGASLDEKPAINLGSLYLRAGDAAKARETLLGVVKEAPGAARAWFELGKAQLQLGEVEAARQSLERAVSTRPGYGEAHLLLAKVYARLGRMEESRAQRQLGLAARP